MKSLTFNKKGETHKPIRYWRTDNVTDLAIYQGSRGNRPDLDFIEIRNLSVLKGLVIDDKLSRNLSIFVKLIEQKSNSSKILDTDLKLVMKQF